MWYIITLLIIGIALLVIILIRNSREQELYYQGTPVYDFDEWYELNEEWIYNEMLNDGSINEDDFNFETELHKQYQEYLRKLNVEVKSKMLKHHIKWD